ncbi:MAG: TRAP transporter large permease [Pseudomonadota bacterium]
MTLPLVLAIIALGLLTGSLLGVIIAGVGLGILVTDFNANFSVLSNAIWNIYNSFTLSAVPVFILLGEILGETGVARRIYQAISPLFERLPGKLLQTNIATCTVFAAINGSSTATTAGVGSIAYGELTGRGYAPRPLVGSIAAGGTLGILIPPSIPLIIYGSWQDVSIGSLFLAAIIPGLLLVGFFMLYIAVSAWLKPDLVPASDRPQPWGQTLRSLLGAWPFLVLLIAVLGTIAAGVATPTESASLGVVTALIIALVYRELTWARLWRALRNSVRIFSTLTLVLLGGIILSQAIALTGIPRDIIAAVEAVGLSGPTTLVLIFLVYLILGCVMGPIEMMLITLPFTFPLIVSLGYDPVWFGIALVILIEAGLLTPPVGVNLFIMNAVTDGQVSVGAVARAVLPYWAIMLGTLTLITVIPDLALALPSFFF